MIRLGNRKPSGLTEKMIENQILSWLKVKGIWATKIKTVGTYDQKLGRFRTPSPWYRRGVADILCCYNGRFIGLEVKTPIGRLSMHQKEFLRDIQAAGGVAAVVRCVEDVEIIFRGLDGVKEEEKCSQAF